MSKLQKILFAILIPVLIVLTIIFRNALAGGVFGGCLLMVVPIYLFNRFINNDEGSDFTDDGNG